MVDRRREKIWNARGATTTIGLTDFFFFFLLSRGAGCGFAAEQWRIYVARRAIYIHTLYSGVYSIVDFYGRAPQISNLSPRRRAEIYSSVHLYWRPSVVYTYMYMYNLEGKIALSLDIISYMKARLFFDAEREIEYW